MTTEDFKRRYIDFLIANLCELQKREDGQRRIYVAGPMRGQELSNFPAFFAAEDELRAAGWDVVNPARHDKEQGFDETSDQGEDPQFIDAALRWDIYVILGCDAMYMLDGWESSHGAGMEHSIARALSLDIIYQSPKSDKYVYGWASALPREEV